MAMDDELYHYGVKGMRWGVHKVKGKKYHPTWGKRRKNTKRGFRQMFDPRNWRENSALISPSRRTIDPTQMFTELEGTYRDRARGRRERYDQYQEERAARRARINERRS